MNHEIPIFFSTDDNYIPYLDVAIRSLIANASRQYRYRIIVLHTGLRADYMELVKRNEQDGFAIEFFDVKERLQAISHRFRNVYHFSVATYYRLFIASLFPQYNKVLYLDCDLVVLGDIAKLYHIPLGECILGAAPEQYVQNTAEFRHYAREALGVDPNHYVNAGVLLLDLEAFRRHNIEQAFIRLITEYDFDLLDPDQAYLNYLCRGRIRMLPNGWNKEPMPLPCEGPKNIVHYALYKKPWQYDDVPDGEYFWYYAERSPFYGIIVQNRAAFGHAERAKKEAAAREILAHAKAIVASKHTFSHVISRG